jgi:hypothetical protein
MNHLRLTNVDYLLNNTTSPKPIEAQLIYFIMALRQNDISYGTIKVLIAPIFTFYQLNDVLLNRKKVHRYLGEYRKIVKGKAYSTEQIQQALQNADHRMRMILLIFVSTGCQIGALPSLNNNMTILLMPLQKI